MKTLSALKASKAIIFECVSGSRAYGLATATSDTDVRGVFILPKEQYYSMDYVGQINNETNDIVYYELKKFMELLAKNNPNIMEMLNVPEDCVRYKHPLFDKLKSEFFLSQLCKDTFANYAFTQIKKARGLNKKIMNPVEKERKSVLDFCYVRVEKDSFPLTTFLKDRAWNAKDLGLARITHMKDCFNLFHYSDHGYQGVARDGANDVCLSSIPKGEKPVALLYFNKDGYSSYCKKYKEYWTWVAKRNEERYKNNVANEKNYDAKNMMHTFRLLHMAKEIGLEGKIHVRRPDRNFLLKIKNAEFEYDDLVARAEGLKDALESIYENSGLKTAPNREEVNALLASLRSEFYKN
ncbi:nucleotidyltransferase domain-containing protein [Aureisphaera galaxeae]|uniref:nucleotidyltransferase domain-containing protein n=1 Tax=Aureisphaera galaxeae TaxID=1538023 RepID=UPI00235007C8|nr:nucleotidyltransferase domain-containing protein [Aureisphaera galaxeae]MDC8002912.1 nucleotidyltransferase domain-containing protein [Aureisphaera galaxeae]